MTPGLLGKLAPRHDARTLKLSTYVDAARLPPAPAHIDWSRAVPAWGMLANDRVGCCTCAAAAHAIMCWSDNANVAVAPDARPLVLTDDDVLAAYAGITGYRPDDPSTDQGAVELDVLNYWRRVGIGGHKLGAFVALELRNHAHVKLAVDLLGGCYIGLAMPAAWQSMDTWSVPREGAVEHTRFGDARPGSWGGHAVNVVGYDAGTLTVVTWGQLQKLTWNAWDVFCDEAWGLLAPEWIGLNGRSPVGLDLAALNRDLASLASGR